MADEYQDIRCEGCKKKVGELAEGQGRYICRVCKGTTVARIDPNTSKVMIVSFEQPPSPEAARFLGRVTYPYQDRAVTNKK